MERPFALHTTWTTYGTWLPGDERGHVSHTLQAIGDWDDRVNTVGAPPASGHERTRELARSLMKHDAVLLNLEQAMQVAIALVDAAKKRSWRIGRAAIMANHVHVVTFDTPPDGVAVRRILKGTTQAALTDRAGAPQRWWTAGGSDRYKNDDEAIENALRYVENQERTLVAIRDNAIVGSLPPG